MEAEYSTIVWSVLVKHCWLVNSQLVISRGNNHVNIVNVKLLFTNESNSLRFKVCETESDLVVDKMHSNLYKVSRSLINSEAKLIN